MIEVRNLTKRYGDLTAIEDVSFNVEKGEILGFLGPNGAGKTTTMRILSCYMPPTSGSATIAGLDIFRDSMEVRKKIGYLPEHPPLYEDMTVNSYLKFTATIEGVPRGQRRGQVDDVVQKCGLTQVTKRLIGKLSKGYRQRVGIAQALIHNPEILILDEPTIGLDPKQIIEIRELIKGLGGERTVILSTHILPEVTMICNKVVIINEGKIATVDYLDRLSSEFKRSQRISLKVKRQDGDILTRLKTIQGVINIDSPKLNSFIIEGELDRDIKEELARVVVMHNWGLEELKTIELSLEEIYLKLTSKEEIVQ